MFSKSLHYIWEKWTAPGVIKKSVLVPDCGILGNRRERKPLYIPVVSDYRKRMNRKRKGICDVTGYLCRHRNIKYMKHENTDYCYGNIEFIFFLYW